MNRSPLFPDRDPNSYSRGSSAGANKRPSNSSSPHMPTSADVERDYSEARWYMGDEALPVEGVNPRVDNLTGFGTPHAFVSLPLAALAPEGDAPSDKSAAKSKATPPAASDPPARSSRPRIDRLAPPKTDSGPGAGTVTIERGERPWGRTRGHFVGNQNAAAAAPENQPAQQPAAKQPAAAAAPHTQAAHAKPQSPLIKSLERRDSSTRTFRLDHADWMPAPHNPSFKSFGLEAPSSSTQSTAPPTGAVAETINDAAAPKSQPPLPQPPQSQAPAAPTTIWQPMVHAPSTPLSFGRGVPSHLTNAVESQATHAPPNASSAIPQQPTAAAALQAIGGAAKVSSVVGHASHETESAQQRERQRIARPLSLTSSLANDSSPAAHSHFDEAQAAANEATHAALNDALNASLQEHERQNSLATLAPRAAWEVDDFRWPTLTTEVLVSQGAIFDRLLRAIRERSDECKVLGITGLRSGDGRTTLSICLARWAASQGYSTLLVDGDLLRGSLVGVSGLDFNRGWQSLEEAGLPVGESLISSLAAPLTLMPVDPDAIGDGDFHRTAKRLDRLINELRPHYDWIIVDAGTAQDLARFHLDSQPSIDVAIVVRHLQATTPQELEAAQRSLVGIGIRHLAVAENFGRRKAAAG